MKRRWTIEEENILLNNINSSPYNLAKAFKKTSLDINRSFTAVQSRWYGIPRSSTCKGTIGLRFRSMESNKAFISISSRKKTINTKVIRDGSYSNYTTVTKSVWKRFLSLFNK